jgi:addiction module RelB/DinJ family antitoxin
MPKVQTSLRIEESTLNEAKQILGELGINFTEAVNVFASMIVQERGLPFDVKISDYPPISKEEARAKVARSVEHMSGHGGTPAEEFFEELLGS